MKFNSQENKKGMKDDLSRIQLLHTEELFDIAIELWKKKWIIKEPAFVQHFDNWFIQRNNYWFEGAGVRLPSANNALESSNGSIKMHQTF